MKSILCVLPFLSGLALSQGGPILPPGTNPGGPMIPATNPGGPMIPAANPGGPMIPATNPGGPNIPPQRRQEDTCAYEVPTCAKFQYTFGLPCECKAAVALAQQAAGCIVTQELCPTQTPTPPQRRQETCAYEVPMCAKFEYTFGLPCECKNAVALAQHAAGCAVTQELCPTQTPTPPQRRQETCAYEVPMCAKFEYTFGLPCECKNAVALAQHAAGCEVTQKLCPTQTPTPQRRQEDTCVYEKPACENTVSTFGYTCECQNAISQAKYTAGCDTILVHKDCSAPKGTCVYEHPACEKTISTFGPTCDCTNAINLAQFTAGCTDVLTTEDCSIIPAQRRQEDACPCAKFCSDLWPENCYCEAAQAECRYQKCGAPKPLPAQCPPLTPVTMSTVAQPTPTPNV